MSRKASELSELLAQADLTLSEEQIRALLDYANLLRKWNRSFNLISATDLPHLESRHFLDSLAISEYLQGQTILDVGTGAGLPGIPLAIANPHRRFILMDSNGKKTRFLFQVKLALELDNVEIENCRVEHYQNDRQIDIVTCRAFASIPDIIRASRHLLKTRTTILAMKGRYPEEELAQLPAGFDVTAIHRLQIPAEDSERHLIEINRAVS